MIGVAVKVVRIATGEEEDAPPPDDGKDTAARMAGMTPERRAEIAKKAAAGRWYFTLTGASKSGRNVKMPLSQVQIIRSLAEALSWFEKELAWGVDPAELRHLTGRVGELYAAMITRGQMALAVNQHGYDVVSADGEHISVKTVTSSTHVTFRKSTFAGVHRVMVLRINIDEGDASIEEVFDGSAAELVNKCRESADGYQFMLSRKTGELKRSLSDMNISAQAHRGVSTIKQYENGTIEVLTNGIPEAMAKPALRKLCTELGISIINGNGNAKNTRTLGADVIASLSELDKE